MLACHQTYHQHQCHGNVCPDDPCSYQWFVVEDFVDCSEGDTGKHIGNEERDGEVEIDIVIAVNCVEVI